MKNQYLLKALLLGALLTPPPLNSPFGAGLLMAQSNAWVVGDQWANMGGNGTSIALADLRGLSTSLSVVR